MLDKTVSYWHRTARARQYPPLTRNIETDTLIVGGGITGVTCAYILGTKGMSAALIEAGSLCDGTTGNTTAKVTIQHGLIYAHLLTQEGEQTARRYKEAQCSALEFVRDVVNKEKIDCGLTDSTAWLFAQSEQEAAEVEREYEAAIKLDIDAEVMKNPAFPHRNLCMTGYHHQAVFHPVRYVAALAEAAAQSGVGLYCGTKAVEIKDGDIIEVRCENGVTIKAKHLLMATQYPLYDGLGFYFARLYPKREYGIAVEAEKTSPDGSYINAGDPARSIRTHVEGDRRVLIVVGEGHYTGRSKCDMKDHFERLTGYAEDIAGVKTMLANWSAQDYETPDRIPYIGRIGAKSHIYVASGYAKWGMTNGTFAGMLVSDIITKSVSRFEETFSPLRPDIQGNLGKIVPEVAGQVGELIKSKFEPAQGIADMRPGDGRIIDFAGNKAGIYLDEDGNVTVVDIACAHMSTHLNYNSAERSWDCPAHGGRFAFDGTLLEGPPKHSLKILYRGRYDNLVAEQRRK